MDISKVKSSPNVLPQTKQLPQVKEALETLAQKRPELLRGEKPSYQVQPKSGKSPPAGRGSNENSRCGRPGRTKGEGRL